MHAAWGNDMRIIKLLTVHGADPSLTDTEQVGALTVTYDRACRFACCSSCSGMPKNTQQPTEAVTRSSSSTAMRTPDMIRLWLEC